jgi:hypothetical protein
VPTSLFIGVGGGTVAEPSDSTSSDSWMIESPWLRVMFSR